MKNNGRPTSDHLRVGAGEGARLVIGGKRPEHLAKGYFVEPTIFDNVAPDMRIFKEEIFGPVLSVTTGPRVSTKRSNSPTAWSMA